MKKIKVDFEKCTGCRTCELVCSLFHTKDNFNAWKSRIRVFRDQEKGKSFPIIACSFSEAECIGRSVIVINGEEYDGCTFCNASCPHRDFFKDPDNGISLICDMCEDDPECIKWCVTEALTLIEVEDEKESDHIPRYKWSGRY